MDFPARSLRNKDLSVKSLFFFHLGTFPGLGREGHLLPSGVEPPFRPKQKVKLDTTEARKGDFFLFYCQGLATSFTVPEPGNDLRNCSSQMMDFDVEVIRRFVHQQYIRHSEQDPCQRNRHFRSAGESAHVAVNLIVFESQTMESQTMEHFTGLRFERVTAQMLVLLLNVNEALKDAVDVISLVRVGHFPLQGFELVMQIADASAACDRFIQNRTALHFLDPGESSRSSSSWDLHNAQNLWQCIRE
jgi:hypothetical protein